MKLLYILNVASRVNNFSYSSIYAANKLGFDFHIAGNWGYKSNEERYADEKKYGIKIHQIDFERSPISRKNKKAYVQLLDLMRKESFDAVHCNTPIGGLLGRLCAKKCNIEKVIYQAHGFHFYKGSPMLNWMVYYPVEKWLARYTKALVTINTEDYAFAVAKKFMKKENIFYVPGVGINLDTFQCDVGIREIVRQDMGFQHDDIILISVGELNKNKNTTVIISALSKIKNPKLHYLVCGVGDEYEKLKKQVKKLKLQNNVHFLGYRTDILDLYATADIFVMPSFREGLSRSIMEAMAMGLPCVVSKIRGNVDMVDEENGGFLCFPNDVKSFSEAINMLSKDEQLRIRMKLHNFKKIKQFELCRAQEEIEKIYTKVFLDEVS